ncbi:MAG: prenyltransferase [Actinomycetota bacterium]
MDARKRTVNAIAVVQLDDGCIPWFPGGHADPWDLTEAAMALDAGGRHDSASAALGWLADHQRPDGTWAAGYRNGETTDPTLDANFCAYVSVGVWHHYLFTRDRYWLNRMWAVVERAVDFAVELQDVTGAVFWARDADYRPWPGALLTSSSCIHLSLRCALAIAQELEAQRPDWELSLTYLAHAIAHRPEAFEPKDEFAMDWYYPVLGGAVGGSDASDRIAERWAEFVLEGYGVRCVDDRPWVTTGETAELALTLTAMGLRDEAFALLDWVGHLRAPDGSYWTGATFPDGVFWPRERPTWGSGAVVLAWSALECEGPTRALFTGQGLPRGLDLSEILTDPL